MRKMLALFAVLAVLALAGCKAGETVYTADDGKTTVTADVKNTGDWCQAGSEWKMSSTAEEQPSNVKMVIEGIVSGGKYDGYCHVTYDVTSEENQANIDFYFNEEGDGYQVMVVNGQTYESAWSGGE